MGNIPIRCAVTGLALFMSAHSAGAHGIAGNRFFVGTLTFDDPSVADEAIVPNFSTLNGPVEGGNATDNRFEWSFTRLLTPYLQAQVNVASVCGIQCSSIPPPPAPVSEDQRFDNW
jgi:hypothetical protein